MKYSAPLTLAGYELSKWERLLFFLTHPGWIKYYSDWKQSLKEDKNAWDLKIPWFTYGAIDWLKKNLKTGSRIFEYGTGGSTLFFSLYASELVAVEHNEKWYKQVCDSIIANPNVKLLHKTPVLAQTGKTNFFPSETFAEYKGYSFENYVMTIDSYPDNYFDVISVDGRCRCACLTVAVKKLKNGGILIIDNSERLAYHDAMARIKNSQRYDFDGFGPGLVTFWRTTIFIK